MRAHILADDGTITNTAEVRNLDSMPGLTLVDAAIGGQIGDKIVNGAVVPKAPTLPAIDDYKAAVQYHLDTNAQRLGYDNIFTAVTYASEPAVPEYQAEGIALRSWRSIVWKAAQDLQDRAIDGQIPPPTIAQLIATLPACPI